MKKFIDSFIFLPNSLWSLTDNFPEGLPNSKCKDCNSSIEYVKAKDKLLLFKCSKCNKKYKNIEIKT